jgi:hypothetical protein
VEDRPYLGDYVPGFRVVVKPAGLLLPFGGRPCRKKKPCGCFWSKRKKSEGSGCFFELFFKKSIMDEGGK